MKLFIHISYKPVHISYCSTQYYTVHCFYHIFYRTIYRSFNRAMIIHVSNQNAFHSAVSFIFYGNTFLNARQASPAKDKGRQHNEKHSKLWSCPWQLLPHTYSTHSGVQVLQALCWLLYCIGSEAQASQMWAPKAVRGQASSVHPAETKSQHRSKTEESITPCVSCKTHRSSTFRHWTQFWT